MAPSCCTRPTGQLPCSDWTTSSASRQARIVSNPEGLEESTDGLETPMMRGKPAPVVSAFVAAVDDAIRAHQPSGGRSAMPRTWRACWGTAVVVTNSMCWARVERARLGTSSLAALWWRCRHRKRPGDPRLVASVRVSLRHHGIPAGRRVLDDTDKPRSKSATPLAPLSTLRDQASGGYGWGQRLVWRVLGPPHISMPVGVVCSQPAPELRAWDKQATGLTKPGVPPPQRPPPPAPPAPYPTQQPRALRLLEAFKAQQPDSRVHGLAADAL